jgi:hypothetical protein
MSVESGVYDAVAFTLGRRAVIHNPQPLLLLLPLYITLL